MAKVSFRFQFSRYKKRSSWVLRAVSIQYSFLDSDDCEGICDAILVNIQDAIRGHDSSCQIMCEAKGTTMRDAGFFLELAFDHVEKTCKLIRFDPVWG